MSTIFAAPSKILDLASPSGIAWFVADGDSLALRFSDSTIDAHAIVGTWDGEGSFSLGFPVRALWAALKTIKGKAGSAPFALDASGIQIGAIKLSPIIPGEGESAPAIPNVYASAPAEAPFMLRGADLSSALEPVIPAMSDDSYRGSLTGVALIERNGEPWAIATDGYRLHASEIRGSTGRIPDDDKGIRRYVIPGAVARFLAKRYKGSKDDLSIVLTRHGISGAGFALKIEAPQGYPDVEQVIPRYSPGDARRLDIDRILGAAESLISAGKAVSCKVNARFTSEGDSLSVASDKPEVTVKADRVGSVSLETPYGLDPRYLKDAIKASGSPETLIPGDGLSPSVWGWGSERFAVVMPVRL